MKTYYNIQSLSTLLKLNYNFLWKYIRKNMEESTSNEIRTVFTKYHVEDFVKAHLHPKNAEIDIDQLIEHSVWTLKEVFEYLQENGVEMHYSTLWRKVANCEVTSIKINTAYRLPVYLVKEEFKKGKFKKKH